MPAPLTLPLDGEDWTVYWLLPNEWLWHRVWEQEPPEAASRRLRATVPGHCGDALLRAGLLPHPFVGSNSRLWEWTAERDWVFEKRFVLPAEATGDRFFLAFEGIDDTGHVYLNGRHVGDHSGQFVPAEWEVTDTVRPGAENRLLVVVERAPRVAGRIGRTSRERRWKARFAYGWDGCVRLPQVGLWDSVLLRVTGIARIRGVAVHSHLDRERTEAALSIVSEFECPIELPATVVAEVIRDGLPAARVEDAVTLFPGETGLVQSAVLREPRLWWPNGLGEAALYTLRLTLLGRNGQVLDRWETEFGIREVEAVPCDGAPPDSLPYGLRVNGRRMWIQGWNWLPLDLFYGSLPLARYERFLRLARAAGVNLLRVWAGGFPEKEAFYRLCDRFGILVWQELPLCGSGLDNAPPTDPDSLRELAARAEAIVVRRRQHPALALWSGGHGLTDAAGRPLAADHPALAELRAAVQLADPQRLWLPTSPAGPQAIAGPESAGALADAHGPWRWLGLRQHPAFYNAIDPLLHSAFACEGTAEPETLAFLFDGPPPAPDRAHPNWMHHGGSAWFHPEPVEAAFGPVRDAVTFQRASQLLQAIGLQYAVEANRRRQWRCAGVLPWSFGEPWPHPVGPSAVDYFGRPKPAYYAVKRAYRPFHVSAAFPTFAWDGEEAFRADVWLHNSGEERALLNVVAIVTDLSGREMYQENLAAEAGENRSELVGDLLWRFPPGFDAPFVLFLEVIDEEGQTLARNAYLHSRAPEPAFAPFLAAPLTALEVAAVPEGIEIRNVGDAVALSVQAHAGEELVEDSDFPLPPGGSRRIGIGDPEAPVLVTAWNAPPARANWVADPEEPEEEPPAPSGA